MKKMIKNLMLVAVAAMGFTACNKEDFGEATNNSNAHDNIVEMTFIAGAPESRTSVAIDGDVAKYSWSAGDKVGFYYVATDVDYKKKGNSSNITIAGDGTATFTGKFDSTNGATAYNIGAFYPGNSWTTHAAENYFNNVGVKIAAAQTLTEGTYDPTADLMIAKPFMGVQLDSETPKTLQFSRIAAIGKMNLKLEGLEANEVINEVVFTLADGTHFNGPVTLDLENSTYTLGESGTSNKVTLSGTLTASADRTPIFFTCFPGEYSGEYTITVETDKASYSKEGTLGNALVFTAGDVLNFNATVGNRVAKEVDNTLSTVSLTSSDIVAINATQAYADAARTINAADGSVWLFKGYRQSASNNFLQLKAKSDSSTPYIKLPTVNGTIQSVVLAVGSASVNSAGNNTRTYYFNDTIGGNGIVNGTGAAEITLNVEGMGKSTGYIQVSGATRVFSITVYYEEGEPAPAVPTLSVKEQPAEVAAAGADVTVELTAENLLSAITVTENADWITNATVTNSTLTFTVTANETTETRTADITLTSGTLSATVNVSQAAAGATNAETITVSPADITTETGYGSYSNDTWVMTCGSGNGAFGCNSTNADSKMKLGDNYIVALPLDNNITSTSTRYAAVISKRQLSGIGKIVLGGTPKSGITVGITRSTDGANWEKVADFTSTTTTTFTFDAQTAYYAIVIKSANKDSRWQGFTATFSGN